MAKNIKNESSKNTEFAIPRENYKLMLIGLVIIIFGFILMTGGGSDDPNVFHEDKMFGFTRISLSSILVIFGFAFEIYAIMKKPKPENEADTTDKSDKKQ
ncbi:MAG: DUF3098 domain-containing protein [Prevotellaceae bacterium]|jgi:hypothetical protein|nr:DUF3098 domain-containing protein [Prevotellaceae bacterium]